MRQAISLVLAILLVACGGGSSSGGGTGAVATTTPAVTSPTTTTPATPASTVTSVEIDSGDDQVGLTNTVLATPLVVKATNSSGAVVAGAEILFSVTSGSGTPVSNSATSDANGKASTQLVLGAIAGAVHVAATARGTSVATRFRMTSVTPDTAAAGSATTYNPDWTDASHAKLTTPNYAETFPQAAVNTLEISMSAAQWASIRTDMTSLYGYDFGARATGAGGGFPEEDPAYVAVTVKYKGKTWKQVGFRLKGNSTLSSAWGSGNWKLPFRLKTTEFEDVFAAIKGQRFYGFKELSFSPGRSDPALLREKVAADVLRAAGIPAAQTAFYRVFVDFGAGQRYVGVYTAVEVIDDTMVKSQFGEDKGNIYKPESRLVTFVESEFEKKNNKTTPDFSDVRALITALNNPLRSANAAQWRTELEAVFNVDHFLKWLAINNAIVNWDTYGAMAHNYYLYNSPTTKLTWIPWDHNESMTGSPGLTGTVAAGGTGVNRSLSLTMNEAAASWPLLRYLADDPVYFARYKAHIKTFKDGAFNQAVMNAMFDRYFALISPFVVGANGEQAGATYTSDAQFTAGLPALKTHVQSRRDLITQFVP